MNFTGRVNQQREHAVQAVEAAPPISTSGSGAYQLDPETGTVTRPNGTRAQLSRTERDVLHVLHMLRGRWVGERDLLAIVWDGCRVPNNLRVHVRNIRRKCGPDVIDTQWQMGYGVGVQ